MDPRLVVVAPLTGFYTVAVTNFLSNGSPPYDFQLQANGIIPEPALALLGVGLAVAGLARRRRK